MILFNKTHFNDMDIFIGLISSFNVISNLMGYLLMKPTLSENNSETI